MAVPHQPLRSDDTEALAPDLNHLQTNELVFLKNSPEQGITDVWSAVIRSKQILYRIETHKPLNLRGYLRVNFLISGQKGSRIKRLPMPRFLRWSSSSFLRSSYLSITVNIVLWSCDSLSCRLETCRVVQTIYRPQSIKYFYLVFQRLNILFLKSFLDSSIAVSVCAVNF